MKHSHKANEISVSALYTSERCNCGASRIWPSWSKEKTPWIEKRKKVAVVLCPQCHRPMNIMEVEPPHLFGYPSVNLNCSNEKCKKEMSYLYSGYVSIDDALADIVDRWEKNNYD